MPGRRRATACARSSGRNSSTWPRPCSTATYCCRPRRAPEHPTSARRRRAVGPSRQCRLAGRSAFGAFAELVFADRARQLEAERPCLRDRHVDAVRRAADRGDDAGGVGLLGVAWLTVEPPHSRLGTVCHGSSLCIPATARAAIGHAGKRSCMRKRCSAVEYGEAIRTRDAHLEHGSRVSDVVMGRWPFALGTRRTVPSARCAVVTAIARLATAN
jgi:hypothetical protein